MNFSYRSYKKELLDRDDIPFDDIRRNMEELDFINTWLGGHKITIEGIEMLMKLPSIKNKPVRICEVGCGGGDNLLAVSKWCTRNKIDARFIGIDKNPYCIKVAEKKLTALNAQLIVSDYRLVNLEHQKPDIIFSSLFCHHFTNAHLIGMLQWMKANAGTGFFINDLHRHPLAYYSIKMLTTFFSKSYLVRNDAPLSVLRGFKRKDWEKIFKNADIDTYAIIWKWAFRYLVHVKH